MYSVKFKHRKPPEGVIESQLMLCIMQKPCMFGMECSSAHSEAELLEWRQRLRLDADQLIVNESHAIKKVTTYRMEILEKLNSQKSNKPVLAELVGGHAVLCNENLFIMHVDKNKELTWMFTVLNSKATSNKLKRIYFMKDCGEFSIECIFYTEKDYVKPQSKCQFWENRRKDDSYSEVQILIRFCAEKFGNYCQELVFDFGEYPKVVRKLGVQVATEETLSQAMRFNPNKFENNELSWLEKHKVINFNGEENLGIDGIGFKLPANMENLVVFDAFKYLDMTLNKQNYRGRLHTLLYIEEYQRRADLQSMSFHMDEFAACVEKPSNAISENYTAHILFDEIVLADLNRLVGKSGKALIRLNSYEKDGETILTPVVYEVIIQNIKSSTIVFELSPELSSLILRSTLPVNVDVCFCLVDVFQTLHNAIDNVELDLIFPILNPTNTFPYMREAYVNEVFSKEQHDAIEVILDSSVKTPVLLLGPFGCGKTRVIAEAARRLVQHCSGNRVLICTHSNSAADHYIEEYFHPLHSVQKNDLSTLPVRINWEHRYVSSVSDRVLAYCLVDKQTGLFAKPTKKDVDKHAIVIATLVTSEVLFNLGLPTGQFTHIFIDEAAQAMEVEAIVPILLANSETKIVLAGDHMQMGEPLSSNVAKELGLSKSLLERLFESYPFDSSCKLKLLENFRSYKDIVDLSSHLFYEDTLMSKRTRPEFMSYPVEFHGVGGCEVLSKENPSYENAGEAMQVMLCITQLVEFWKKHNVHLSFDSICVVAFYPAQVKRIRKVLRKNHMPSVKVESVYNIQGLEFDIMIISTVRTYCEQSIHDDAAGKEMGFFSDPRLLITSLTRAKDQVFIVGDPLALCTIGKCRACWKTIIRRCSENKTYNSVETFEELLSNVELILTPETNGNSIVKKSSFVTGHSPTQQKCTVGYGVPRTIEYQHQPFFRFTPLYFIPNYAPSQLNYTFQQPPVVLLHYPSHPMAMPRAFNLSTAYHESFLPNQHSNYSVSQPLSQLMYLPSITTERSTESLSRTNQMKHGEIDQNRSYAFTTASNVSTLKPLSRYLPDASTKAILVQKLDYMEEYIVHLLDKMTNLEPEQKDLIKSQIADLKKSSFKENSIAIKDIECSAEEIHLTVENKFKEYIKPYCPQNFVPSIRSKKTYSQLRGRVAELKIFIENELYNCDELFEYSNNPKLINEIKLLGYFIEVLQFEINTCGKLIKSPESMLVLTKLEFLEKQVLIAETKKVRLEEHIDEQTINDQARGLVDNTESDTDGVVSFKMEELSVNGCPSYHEEAFGEKEGDRKKDFDVAQWFQERRNDPYVQEYVTKYERLNAGRLASPGIIATSSDTDRILDVLNDSEDDVVSNNGKTSY